MFDNVVTRLDEVHLGGWALCLEADGTVVATSPDGIDYEDPPPGRTQPVLVAGEQRARYRPWPGKPKQVKRRATAPARAGP